MAKVLPKHFLGGNDQIEEQLLKWPLLRDAEMVGHPVPFTALHDFQHEASGTIHWYVPNTIYEISDEDMMVRALDWYDRKMIKFGVQIGQKYFDAPPPSHARARYRRKPRAYRCPHCGEVVGGTWLRDRLLRLADGTKTAKHIARTTGRSAETIRGTIYNMQRLGFDVRFRVKGHKK
jgi:ribosomal protein L34E